MGNLIFVVDIDGTIADTDARVAEITNKYQLDNEGRWTDEHIDEFTKTEVIKKDELLPGAEILPELARKCKAKIVFLTGRSERARVATRIWLKNKLNIFDSVPLVMRPEGDMSGPSQCKENIFINTVLKMHPESSFIFFDDDEKLLQKYARFGLAIKAPDCWKIIRFADFKEERILDWK